MTYPKRLTAALLALVSVFIFTFHNAAPAKAATLTDAIDLAQKYGPKLLEIKAGYDNLGPLFKQGAWDQVEETLPGLNKGLSSLLGTFAKKAPRITGKSQAIVASVTSYLDGFDEAEANYKTAKSTYKKAESTYKKEVKSDFDKLDDGLDALLKFLPKAPKAPKA